MKINGLLVLPTFLGLCQYSYYDAIERGESKICYDREPDGSILVTVIMVQTHHNQSSTMMLTATATTFRNMTVTRRLRQLPALSSLLPFFSSSQQILLSSLLLLSMLPLSPSPSPSIVAARAVEAWVPVPTPTTTSTTVFSSSPSSLLHHLARQRQRQNRQIRQMLRLHQHHHHHHLQKERITMNMSTTESAYRSSVRRRRRICYSDLMTATTATTTTKTATTTMSTSSSSSSSTSLHMALIPLPSDDVYRLLDVSGTSPTGKQYAVYWGTTKRDRYNRLLESSIISFVGVFFCYFLSFVLGGFVSTILGSLFVFWAVISPDLKARQRNWEFLGGRPIIDTPIPPPPAPPTITSTAASGTKRQKRLRSLPPTDDYDDYDYDDGYDYDYDYDDDETNNSNNFMNTEGLYGSLFLGSVKDVCVVEDTTSVEEYDLDDFQDYDVEDDELEQIVGTPYLLRMKVSDGNNNNDGSTGGRKNRELQVHARLKEEYLGIKEGMAVTAVLLSTSRSFEKLAALTDIYIIDERCSVGDYPYLNQVEMEAMLEEDDDLWNLIQAERYNEPNDDDYDYDYDGMDDDADRDDQSKVLVRRQRRR